MFNRFTSFTTAFAVILGTILAFFTPAPARVTAEKAAAGYSPVITAMECADKIYAVEAGNIREGEINTAVCLQGLVNKTSPRLYIIYDSVHRNYLRTFEAAGKEVIRTNEDGQAWTLPLLLKEFSDCITDHGYTLYRDSEFAEGLNTATNYAAAFGYLAVPENLRQMAEDAGLTLKYDFSQETYDYAFQLKTFLKLRRYFNRRAVVHVKTVQSGLRDLAVQQGFYTFYTGDDPGGWLFLLKILGMTGKNTVVLGWGETEVLFVRLLSLAGCSIIASDWSRDASYIASFGFEGLKQAEKKPALPDDPSKHYVAIQMSDGDNSQWIQNGFGHFFSKTASYDFPVTWTFPLMQTELSPVSAKAALDAADENDLFTGGASGIGYMNPTIFRTSALDRFTRDTAARAMSEGINIISVIDEVPDAFFEPTFVRKMRYYTRFDNIDGCLLMMGDRYMGAGGKVWFVEDKPVLSVRFSLWHPDGEGTPITSEWLKEQAEIVNSCPADINSVNGYTLLNVHPWTISVGNLAEFVSYLDDDIELVTADTLLGMISANCPHQTAAPG